MLLRCRNLKGCCLCQKRRRRNRAKVANTVAKALDGEVVNSPMPVTVEKSDEQRALTPTKQAIAIIQNPESDGRYKAEFMKSSIRLIKSSPPRWLRRWSISSSLTPCNSTLKFLLTHGRLRNTRIGWLFQKLEQERSSDKAPNATGFIEIPVADLNEFFSLALALEPVDNWQNEKVIKLRVAACRDKNGKPFESLSISPEKGAEFKEEDLATPYTKQPPLVAATVVGDDEEL